MLSAVFWALQAIRSLAQLFNSTITLLFSSRQQTGCGPWATVYHSALGATCEAEMPVHWRPDEGAEDWRKDAPAPRWPAAACCGAGVCSGRSPAAPLLPGDAPAFVPTAASPPFRDSAQPRLLTPVGQTRDSHLASPLDRRQRDRFWQV